MMLESQSQQQQAKPAGHPRRRRGATQGKAAALQAYKGIELERRREMDGFKEGRREKKSFYSAGRA